MYEARQNKEKVSRRIDAAGGGARQRIKMNRQTKSNFLGGIAQLRAVDIYCNIDGTYRVGHGRQSSRKFHFSQRNLFLIHHNAHPQGQHIHYGNMAIRILRGNGIIPQNAHNIQYNINTFSRHA